MNTIAGLEKWFEWLLETSWQAAVLAALILLAQFLLRKRLSPVWRHGLWFLLLVRLVMPMTPSSAVSIFNLAQPPRQGETPYTVLVPKPVRADTPAVTDVAPARERPLQSIPAPDLSGEQVQQLRNRVRVAAAPDVPAVSHPSKPLSFFGIAAVVWLGGAFLLGLRFAWSNYRFGRKLEGYLPVQDELFGKLLRQCAELLGVTQRVIVIETDRVDSPAVFGLWRKWLLLPEGLREELTPEELRHVLRHELAHIRRRDPELNCLVATLQILHWFNPVLWFAFARMRADRELATDELALAHTQAGERTAYGETILKVLEGLSERPVLRGLVGIGESKAQIGERIRAIARGSVGPHWRWAACALAVVIAGIAMTSAREEAAKGKDLLKNYPTTLTAGDAVPARARRWQFTEADIFQVSRFTFDVGKRLRVEAGPSDLGIGHCGDGAVWAVLIPRQAAKLNTSVTSGEEEIGHLWLRFHPSRVGSIFPAETVAGAGRTSLQDRMRAIAEAKMTSSWQAGGNAMIPEPKDMTVDADTKDGPRRFFVVDTEAGTAEYIAFFADKSVKAPGETTLVSAVDTNCASVVSVAPPHGAQDVELEQRLRIRFDRPVNPHNIKLDWLAGGFQPNGSIQASSDRTEFIIPVRLTPGREQTLAVNHDPHREMWARAGNKGKPEPSPLSQAGFKDANGVTANEFRWSFSTKEPSTKADAPKPKVVNVSPASGSTTPVLALVEITFDQPMRPPGQSFPYQEKRSMMEGPSVIPSIDYDSKAHRFTLPALLRPDDDVRLTLKGFYSAGGVAADPVVLHYQTGPQSMDSKYEARAKAAAKDPKLQRLLASMKQARASLNSGVETVQTIQLGMAKDAFNSIEAKTSTFKWQGADKAYADITGPMMTAGAFILGSDGVNCWLYSENEKGEKRLDQTPVPITEQQVFLVDPFGLRQRSVDEVLAEDGLVLGSNATLEGRPCYRVEKWEVNLQHFVSATQTQWWIDEETLLPKQLVSYSGNWCQIVRFDFTDLNRSLPDSAFQPPAAAQSNAHPLFFDKEPAPGERRFLRINDGSGGRMSGRLGWHGASGTTSSGLN